MIQLESNPGVEIPVSMEAERAGRVSDPFMEGHPCEYDHWRCTFTHDETGAEVVSDFYMGLGHNGKAPTAEEVMECMVSDSSAVDNALGWQDWAEEYGMLEDAQDAEGLRRIEERFGRAEEQAAQLRDLLGDGYDAALWGTEE